VNGVKYFYTLKATNAAGTSAASAEVYATAQDGIAGLTANNGVAVAASSYSNGPEI